MLRSLVGSEMCIRDRYSYNAFQARDRRDKSECDSAVYSSLHGIQGCHLVLFRFFNTKNAQKYLNFYLATQMEHDQSSYFCWGPAPVGPTLVTGPHSIFSNGTTHDVAFCWNSLLTRWNVHVTSSGKHCYYICHSSTFGRNAINTFFLLLCVVMLPSALRPQVGPMRNAITTVPQQKLLTD